MNGPAPVRTSITHPIRVDWLPLTLKKGRIGITICPGKRALSSDGFQWERDRGKDMDDLVTAGVDVLVNLMEPKELEWCGIATPIVTDPHEIEVINYPIKDGGVPNDNPINLRAGLISVLLGHLRQGHKVVIHCQGGLGRSGVIAGCLAVEAAQLRAGQALAVLQQARGQNCPETPAQREYVARYAEAHALSRHR